MEKKLFVRPLGRLARLADILMMPLMYAACGLERPQQTHRWNNTQLQLKEVDHFDRDEMVHCTGMPNAIPRNSHFYRYHVPLLGGWRDYVVLEPAIHNEEWFVGWITDIAGVSRKAVRGQVRMLCGPNDVSFFGVSAETNAQIKICQIATGRIGDKGQYADVPLL